MMDKLEKLVSKYAGKNELKVLIREPSENISFEMFSRKYKIDPSNEFLKELEDMEVVYNLL